MPENHCPSSATERDTQQQGLEDTLRDALAGLIRLAALQDKANMAAPENVQLPSIKQLLAYKKPSVTEQPQPSFVPLAAPPSPVFSNGSNKENNNTSVAWDVFDLRQWRHVKESEAAVFLLPNATEAWKAYDAFNGQYSADIKAKKDIFLLRVENAVVLLCSAENNKGWAQKFLKELLRPLEKEKSHTASTNPGKEPPLMGLALKTFLSKNHLAIWSENKKCLSGMFSRIVSNNKNPENDQNSSWMLPETEGMVKKYGRVANAVIGCEQLHKNLPFIKVMLKKNLLLIHNDLTHNDIQLLFDVTGVMTSADLTPQALPTDIQDYLTEIRSFSTDEEKKQFFLPENWEKDPKGGCPSFKGSSIRVVKEINDFINASNTRVKVRCENKTLKIVKSDAPDALQFIMSNIFGITFFDAAKIPEASPSLLTSTAEGKGNANPLAPERFKRTGEDFASLTNKRQKPDIPSFTLNPAQPG